MVGVDGCLFWGCYAMLGRYRWCFLKEGTKEGRNPSIGDK